jgi:hypothetical protein
MLSLPNPAFGRRSGTYWAASANANRGLCEIPGGWSRRCFEQTLVQSIPRFAKDGAIHFYLAPNLNGEGDLKFDTNAIDGLGNRIMAFH